MSNILIQGGGNSLLSDANLRLTSGAATTYVTDAIDFQINGRHYAKAAVSAGATPTNGANTRKTLEPLEEDQGCIFTWQINAAGTIAVTQSRVQDLDADKAFIPESAIPDAGPVAGGYVPIATHTVKYTGTATFQFGTSNWNIAGLEEKIINLITMINRPPADATS